MKATLSNHHQSPQKTRLVANAIRGKSVVAAKAVLAFLPQKSSPIISKLLDSAVANAKQKGLTPESLMVKTITVDKGGVLRRMKPMARGRSARFARTLSIVSVELGEVVQKAKGKAQKVRATKTKKKDAETVQKT